MTPPQTLPSTKKWKPDVNCRKVGAKRHEADIRIKRDAVRIVKQNEVMEKQKSSRCRWFSRHNSEQEQKATEK